MSDKNLKEFSQGTKFEGDDMIFDEDMKDDNFDNLSFDNIEFYLNGENNFIIEKIDGLIYTRPKDWVNKEIKEIGKVITGKTPPTTQEEYWGGDFPWYTTPNFKNGKLLKSQRMITKEGKTKTPLIPIKSTLVTCIGEIGQTAFTTHECSINQQINSVTAFDDVNPLFLNKLLSYSTVKIKHFSEKVVVPMLKKSNFEKIKLSLPESKLEQSKIAFVIIQQQNLINDLKEQKELKGKEKQYFTQEELSGRLRIRLSSESNIELIKKGILYIKDEDSKTNILTCEVVEGKEDDFNKWLNDGFDSKVEFYLNGDDNWNNVKVNNRMVDIPMDWEIDKLGNFCFSLSSSIDKIDKYDTPTTMVNYMDVYNNKKNLIYEANKFQKTSAKKAQTLSSNLLRGDILITPSSETKEDIGHSATIFTDFPNCVYSYHLVRIRQIEQKIDILFSSILMNSNFVRAQLITFSQGLTRMTLKKENYKNTYVFLPSKLEQTLISTHITMYDNLIEDLDTKIKIEEERLEYLTRELLSGRLRVR